MNKWYRKSAVKGILTLIAISSAVFMISMAVLVGQFAMNTGGENIFSFDRKSYVESKTFANDFQNAIINSMSLVRMKDNFETDGKYDPEKIVDILEYGKNMQITGENKSGVAYYLGDLIEWSMEDYDGTTGNPSIIVCQKSDGTYYYYYLDEFLDKVSTGELKVEVTGYSETEVLNMLKDGSFNEGYFADAHVKDEKNEMVYTSFWNFYDGIKEAVPPIGGDNILDVVNNNPDLNGKLSKIYSDLRYMLEWLMGDFDYYQNSSDWSEGNTNLTYIYVDKAAKTVYTNRTEYQDFVKVNDNIANLRKADHTKYVIVQPKLSDFESNIDISANEWDSMVKGQRYVSDGDFIFAAAVDTSFPIQDDFYLSQQSYDEYVPFMNLAVYGGITAAVLLLAALIWLTIVAGRRAEDEEMHVSAFDRWKTELAAAAVIFIWGAGSWVGLAMGVGSVFNTTISTSLGYYGEMINMTGFYISIPSIVEAGIYAGYTMSIFLIGYLSLVRRIKAGSVWKDSVLRAVCVFLGTLWKNRTITFRAAVTLGGFILLHWMVLLMRSGIIALIALAADVVAFYFIVAGAIAKDRVRKGICKIAGGDLQYQIPLEDLRGENRDMAEMVNDIGSGLQKAVEESVKSERLKTDLITNVSHDIKTPLTSIINYVDILKRENIENPRIQGYLKVLEEKAQRLKTLTEDVVEASKVSSGNISLEMMDVNFGEMLQQTAGEFAEKFAARNLELVQSIPDEAAVIHVDGRRLWRVLENLYGNAAKYAMPGTRIYADLILDHEKAKFSLKNVSEYPLNINADELKERFIRGDVSRRTEGSGLGLSIAESLVKLQGGSLDLYLDGDLFKATVTFDRKRAMSEDVIPEDGQ